MCFFFFISLFCNWKISREHICDFCIRHVCHWRTEKKNVIRKQATFYLLINSETIYLYEWEKDNTVCSSTSSIHSLLCRLVFIKIKKQEKTNFFCRFSISVHFFVGFTDRKQFSHNCRQFDKTFSYDKNFYLSCWKWMESCSRKKGIVLMCYPTDTMKQIEILLRSLWMKVFHFLCCSYSYE